jgi:nicotinate phosphoribosyltransferase
LDFIDIGELQEQVDEIRKNTFTAEELDWLRAQDLFPEGYIEYLATSELPEVLIEKRDGWLHVEYEGQWASAILWETPLLATITNLYNYAVMPFTEGVNNADFRLNTKVDLLNRHPNLHIMEFGTRRRYDQWVQEHVIQRLMGETTNLVGTSNPHLARKYGLPVSGTQAHQLYMVLAAAMGPTNFAYSQQEVMLLWETEYSKKPHMMFSLTDTFGTPFFLKNLDHWRGPEYFSETWRGFRQDSGNPIAIGDSYIKWYEDHGINPMDHTIVFSDALDLNKMLSIAYHFDGRINYVYGVGGNLSNDVGLDAPSTVIKPVSVNGFPTVKLSDDLAKAIGSRDDINRYKELAGYGR